MQDFGTRLNFKLDLCGHRGDLSIRHTLNLMGGIRVRMFGPGAFIAPPWSFTQLPNAALGMLSAFDFLALTVALLFSYGHL